MRVLANRIPNAQLHIINDGHLFLLTQADVIVPLVTTFLTEP
jgi:pimeloyl-ACP methyl ester carboxylesterase